MTAADEETRLALSKQLEGLRSHIRNEKLVLFIGEQVSILDAPGKAKPSLDDWWGILNSREGLEAIYGLEDKFLHDQQQTPSRVHNALRNVGRFPVVITTNMDELLEGFLWKSGNSGEKIRLDQVAQVAQSWPKLRRDLIIKCYGDGSFNARVKASAKEYFESFCGSLENEEVEFMQRLFHERSVLFLGCNPSHPVYSSFLSKFAENAKVTHYMFESSDAPGLTQRGSLNILKAKLEIWEFVQFLSTGSIEANIEPRGQVFERSYLRTQREEYLRQQLELEKQASEIIYHTMAITNALSPDEYFEQISRPAIDDMFRKDPFGVYSEEKVIRTMDGMKGRRDNLLELIKKGSTRVTALFFYHEVKKEIQLWRSINEHTDPAQKKSLLLKCKISISKYAKATLLCNSFMRSGSSFDIRIVGGLTEKEIKEMTRETFALIRLKGGTDEAICYAETATAGDRKFASQLININGEEVLNRRKVYEKSRGRAWNPENSMLKLVTAVMRENEELKAKFGIEAIEKEDLKSLETLSRISHKVASKLDSDSYFQQLGEGNFGQVFKAQRKGQAVAVKVLKNIQQVKDIENFEREVDTLRKASHPNIVEVIDCIALQNSLAIVMEFMAGGNLKSYLEKKRGQGKQFTLRFIEGIGSAINHLHALNLIHRDVKPENIFLSEDEHTENTLFKLGDFGLARATEGTRQTKTMIGSYRYMAPEVVKSGGHYSNKADVHSFGLCLIEVISGQEVFADIQLDQTVYQMKMAGQNPTIPEISEEEFGAELRIKVRLIIEECLKAVHSRPSMQRVLQILDERVVTQKNRVELFCVGTGQGTTAVLHGEPSASVIIFHDNKPLLMVDVGQGVIKACMDKFGKDFSSPGNVFITHNHLDHAGELPIFCLFESKRRHKAKQPKVKLLCGPEVVNRLKTHRLNEMLSLYTPEQVADWVECHQGGDPVFLDSEKQFYIQVHKSLHGETCYGFLLYFQNKPVLGYSADSGFEENLYEFIFQAPTVLVDARKHGSKEHASFSEVEYYVKTRREREQAKSTTVYVTGYGRQTEYPDEGVTGVKRLEPNQYITLVEGEDYEHEKSN